MSACVSPPQLRTSHIVAVAPSIAHAASIALPPCWKIIAPAAAPSGFPVSATQCLPCSGGRCVWTAGGRSCVAPVCCSAADDVGGEDRSTQRASAADDRMGGLLTVAEEI